jgi:hypothetical protein
VLADKTADYLTVGCQRLDGGFLIIAHESAVTNNISAENGGEFAFKTLIVHFGTLILRSQTKNSDDDLVKGAQNQMSDRIRFWQQKTASGQVVLQYSYIINLYLYPNHWVSVNHN